MFRGVARLLVLAGLAAAGTVHALDLNNNGMSDVWEEHYGIRAGEGALDPDGDGLNNLQESQLGTDPRDPNSKLSISASLSRVDEVLLLVQSKPGKTYQIETSKDLRLWSMSGPLIQSLSDSISLTFSTLNPGFFRVRWIADIDSDSDGFSAWDENVLGTRDDDADQNGLPDQWELRVFGYTNVDPDADPDGDGVSNFQEFLANTEPLPPAPVIRLDTPNWAQLLR